MATRDQLFPSKYLKGHDLRGHETTVTIDYVESTKIRGDKVNIIHFENKDKGLVMNVTIYNQIAGALGEEDTDKWAGRDVTIFPTEVEFNGEMKSVVRIRPFLKGASSQDYRPAPPPPDPDPSDLSDDDIPF